MLISCLCPTFNRYPRHTHLLEEAIESFLRQDHPDRELIVCNDQPKHTFKLPLPIPNIKIINHPTRFPSFAEKMDFMISQAQGDYLCRWDDDDISLPHRLSYSARKLGVFGREWRCENYIYAPKSGKAVVDYAHGNTHLTSTWHRDLLRLNGGRYPWQWPGGEDQQFNRILTQHGYPAKGEMIPDEDIYYIYRWGVGFHWSGPGGNLQEVYDKKGLDPVEPCNFTLQPHWQHQYDNSVATAIQNTDPQKRATYAHV